MKNITLMLLALLALALSSVTAFAQPGPCSPQEWVDCESECYNSLCLEELGTDPSTYVCYCYTGGGGGEGPQCGCVSGYPVCRCPPEPEPEDLYSCPIDLDT